MILYEVNLTVDASVTGEYMEWLKPHVKEMLGFPGFESADIFEREEDGSGNWTVLYRVSDRESLERYFREDAPRMRGDALKRFEGRFTATRRILKKVDA